MRTRFIFFIHLVISLLYINYCKSQEIHFDVVHQTEGGWGAIHAMVQDAQGFLWLATDEGLYRSDGMEYISYRNEPSNSNSLARDWIESLYADKDGFLLIGTHGSGLDRFDIATGKFTHYHYNDKDTSSLSNDIITAITKDKQGIIWIGTHDGLDQFNPATGKFIRYKNNPPDPSSLSDNQVRVLFVDNEGTLWVGTKSPWVHDGGTRVGGLNRFIAATGKFIRYMHNPEDSQSIIDNCITAIFEDSRNNFWIGTAGNGLDIMNKTKGTFEHYLYNPENSGTLNTLKTNGITQPDYDYITFIKEDIKRNIWIGTLLSGINIYNPLTQKIDYYGSGKASKDSLSDNKFSAAFRTTDNLFWVAAWSGNLYKINPYKPLLPAINIGKAASDFYEDRNGDFWMGTFEGLLKRNKDGSLQQFLIDKDTFSRSNNITAIRGDDQYNLWVASMHSGLFRFSTLTNTFTRYHREDGKPNSLICDTILSLAKSKDNKLWVGTANGLDLLDNSSGVFKHYAHDPKDSNSLGGTNFSDVGSGIYCVTVTGNNNLWLTVANAVNRFDKTTSHFKRYIFNIYPNYILEDNDRNIWVATDAGLFKYDKEADNFFRFYDSSGILKANTAIYNITEDNRENLWLRIDKGFIKLNTKKSEASIYENDDPVSGSPVLKRYITQSGEILSGMPSGYYAFYPDNFLKDPPPAIVITGFSLSEQPLTATAAGLLNKPVYQTNEIYLKHNQNIFSLEFTSIDFTGNDEKKYILYMLEGYDKNWRKAEAEEVARYYSVPPGKYIFKVKALGSDGMWAEKNITISIFPPWWTRWWAYCIYGILFIAVMYALQRLQKQRVIQAERERTRERELAQAREIEKAYTELKSTQAQLIQAEKMASLGELTAGIAHEIQNPLNFVNNFSEINNDLIDELKTELATGNQQQVIEIANNIKDNEQKINHHGKRADAIVKGMLQHSRKNTGIKEPADINALCDEYLRLAYHGFRSKDPQDGAHKNFNTEMKTDFDESIGKINIVPQDIGRVLLNIYNNAFYAINEKKKTADENYKPTMFVSTKKLDNKIFISVRDNGNGIPQNIIDKIFQPFFTTKPTGQGTGLGLSLSYDIITKQHNGTIKVESKEGEGSEFIITLPV